MTEEEKQAIEFWEEKLKSYKEEIKQRQNDEFKGYGTLEDVAKIKYCNLHTVLNLIERQQREKELHIKLEQQYKKEYLDAKEEIEKYKHLYSLALNNTVKADRENLEKDKYIDKLENKLMYALSPTTHELALNTQEQFKTIIRENIEEDTYTIKRALKEYWEDK